MLVANWNNYPRINARLWEFRTENQAVKLLDSLSRCIPRGLGRSYGDCSLEKNIISTPDFKRFIALDQKQEILECEAGISLDQILRTIIPRGLFLPVTPGTRHVTLGGAIASDVHGKNHPLHGAFGRHVLSLLLLTPGGEVIDCSREKNAEIFYAVCGGMGLLGLILSARIRLMPIQSTYISQLTIPAENLDHLMDLFETHEQSTYSVAWLDLLSRGRNFGHGLFMLGEHCLSGEITSKDLRRREKFGINIPFFMPGWIMNEHGLRAFNNLYHLRGKSGPGRSFPDLDDFFYPLDKVHNWNRFYGRKGFLQYQFVLPKEHSRLGLEKIQAHIQASGILPFLAVLKLLGPQAGPLSFPLQGYTLALDFPIKPGLSAMLSALDRLVHNLGGRIYLAKDARMSKLDFRRGYPEISRFLELKNKLDPKNKMASLQSKRLGLCAKPY